jgi:pimeloyl-ACP methyl ester carboxylesterase
MRKRLLISAAVAATPLTIAAAYPLARLAIDRFETLSPDELDAPGKRVRINGVSLRYIDEGSGFPIVLIHGFGGSAYDFRTLLPALTARFRGIAVDLPGFGYSDRDAPELSATAWVETLHALLVQLGIERAVFAGHSLGGGVAQRFAAQYPQMVERLLLIGSVSAADRQRRPIAGWLNAALMTLVQGGIAAFGGASWLARRTVADPAQMRGAVLEGHLQPLRIRGSAAAVRQWLRDAVHDEPIDLSRLTMPTLLLWGERDGIVKLPRAEQLRAALPQAQLEIVPGAGHMVLEERPDESNRLVLAFLDDLGAPPARRNGASAGTAAPTPA